MGRDSVSARVEKTDFGERAQVAENSAADELV